MKQIQRLAVLADIHSNYHAFRACVDWIEHNEIDSVLFVGDYVSDCPYPQKTMQLINEVKSKYQTWFVRGNREDTMIEKYIENVDWKYPEGSIRYTVEHLNPCDIEFFKEMPKSQWIKMSGLPGISMAHGDFHHTRNKVYPDNQYMRRLLEEMQGEVHICGHTHRPFLYKCNQKLVLNPGSVGVPVSGIPQAEMALLVCEGQHWHAQLLRLQYDFETAIREFEESGLNIDAGVWGRCIKAVLGTGRHYCEECVALVGKYAKESGLGFDSQVILERAARELGI